MSIEYGFLIYRNVYAIIYKYVYTKGKPLLYKSRVAEKSIKGALNLWDLLCLTNFIYIIYLYMILVWLRLLELKFIYLLQEHYTKLVAERSYHLPCG
jgi:hypothetical protein